MNSHLLAVVATGLMLGLVIGVVIDFYRPKLLMPLLRRLGLFKN